jgi:hypothetical protein
VRSSSTYLTIAAAGNVTIVPPSSGNTLTTIALSDATVALNAFGFIAAGSGLGGAITDLNAIMTSGGSQGVFRFDAYSSTATNKPVLVNNANGVLSFITNATGGSGTFGKQIAFADDDDIYIRKQTNGAYGDWCRLIRTNAAGNVTIGPPSSGVGLTVSAVSGTHSTKIADSANTSYNAGYLEVPLNTQNTAYTTVLADAGKAIYHSDGTARTYTIDSNANVAYPIGTTLTFVNDASAAVNVTIAITSDTLVLSPGGTTGSRTLAQYGRATAHKVTSTRWIIAGTGLT